MPLDLQPTEEQATGPLGYEPPDKVAKPEDKEPEKSTTAFVKAWAEKVRKAKAKWEPDFKRMRSNMDFVAGFQWNSQKQMTEDRYIANFTIRSINQKVASLYARNPKVVAQRRQRLDFQMWDGKMESVMQALGTATMAAQSMGFVPPEAMALLTDFQQGRTIQQLVEKIGRTLEIIYQYQQDTQEPDFKTQAKEWVRRAAVCGVGYIKVIFCRDYEHNDLTQSETRQSTAERVQRAKAILEKMEKGEIEEDDQRVETLKNLIASLGLDPTDYENVAVKERLVFDFPTATSIIPDEKCRCLKGFIGAHWIAEEFFYPLDFVNAMYETDIKSGGDVKHYDAAGKAMERNTSDNAKDDPSTKPIVCLWQVYDLDTKSTFIICDGHNDFVMEPEVVTPATKSFWTIFPLTFNDIETEPGCKTTIFPPSDVQLLMPMQKEWNRTRQALRQQRKANAPKYMVPKGHLSEADKDAIENAEDNQVVELENLPSGADPSKVVVPLQVAAIDPAVYDTKPLQEDALLSTGQQEANVGPAQPNVTATVGSIAEQSRMTVTTSNIDDLDDCLSSVARCGGEMLMREMSQETVRHIAGPGAAWPEQNRDDFLNELELEVVAASSGRPNKVVDIANFEKIAPLIMQAGGNPQAVIREAIKRLDDRLDPTDFFPLPMPAMQPAGPQQGAQQGPAGAPPQGRKPKRANAQGQQQMLPPPSSGMPANQP